MHRDICFDLFPTLFVLQFFIQIFIKEARDLPAFPYKMPPHASGWDAYEYFRLSFWWWHWNLSYLDCCFGSLKLFLQRLVSGQECAAQPLVFAQTALSDTRTQQNTVSHLSDTRKGPALANPSCRRQGKMPESATQGFLFSLPLSIVCLSLSYPRCCCPHLTFSNAHNASGLTCHAHWVTFTHFSLYANLKTAWQETFAQHELSNTHHFFGNVQYTQRHASHAAKPFILITLLYVYTTHQQKSRLMQHKTEQ